MSSSLDSEEGLDNLNEEKKEKLLNIKDRARESMDRNMEYSVQEIIAQLKIECRNFLVAEFKLILFYALILCVVFYFFGKTSICLFFIIFFLLGILISLLCAYLITTVAVSNCEIILNQSK
jgi:hypothetical protein